jgi:hypothetical protein
VQKWQPDLSQRSCDVFERRRMTDDHAQWIERLDLSDEARHVLAPCAAAFGF